MAGTRHDQLTQKAGSHRSLGLGHDAEANLRRFSSRWGHFAMGAGAREKAARDGLAAKAFEPRAAGDEPRLLFFQNHQLGVDPISEPLQRRSFLLRIGRGMPLRRSVGLGFRRGRFGGRDRIGGELLTDERLRSEFVRGKVRFSVRHGKPRSVRRGGLPVSRHGTWPRPSSPHGLQLLRVSNCDAAGPVGSADSVVTCCVRVGWVLGIGLRGGRPVGRIVEKGSRFTRKAAKK